MNVAKRILVPVDFSDPSRAALDYALSLKPLLGAEITVLHVWEAPRYSGPDMMMIGLGAPLTLIDYTRRRAGKDMQELLDGLRRKGNDVHGLLEAGNPAVRIVEIAARDKFDLIVMGTHGRSGFDRFLVGSVAEKVVRTSPCPVLTVRVPDESGRVSYAVPDAPAPNP
jgi:nucleotide-binding universal stress UspA family protein